VVVSGGRVTEPKLLSRPTPVWPAIAKSRALSGTVILQAIVDKKGAVTNVKVTEGNPILAESAKDAVLHSRYEPGLLNGQPTDVPVEIHIVFKGSGD
jgi:TonB family protein